MDDDYDWGYPHLWKPPNGLLAMFQQRFIDDTTKSSTLGRDIHNMYIHMYIYLYMYNYICIIIYI